MNIEKSRYNMIEQQVRPWDVLDQKVLDSLKSIPREAFVPEKYTELAFADMSLPFGDKEGHCMLEPKLEARLVQSLCLEPEHQVYVVGAGTGYVLALIAQQVRSVLAYEIDAWVVDQARAHLQKNHIENVTIKHHDGLYPDFSMTFDRILLTGSIAQRPHALLHFLPNDGFMIAVVGKSPIMQAMRFSPMDHRGEALFDTLIPPLVDAQTSTFIF